jgi:hypothetical protein
MILKKVANHRKENFYFFIFTTDERNKSARENIKSQPNFFLVKPIFLKICFHFKYVGSCLLACSQFKLI